MRNKQQPHRLNKAKGLGLPSNGLILLYAVTLPAEAIEIIPGRSPSSILGVAVIAWAGVVLIGKARRSPLIIRPRLVVGLIIFTATLLLNTLINHRVDVADLARLLLVLATSCAIYLTGSVSDVRRYLQAFSIGATALALYMMLRGSFDPELGVVGSLGNANDLAAVFAVSFAIGAEACRRSLEKGRFISALFALGVVLVNVTGAILTGSRTGALALVASVIAAVVVNWSSLRAAGRLILVTAPVACIVALGNFGLLPKRLLTIATDVTQLELTGRDQIWAAMGDYGYTLLGHGVSTTASILDATANTLYVAHNVWLGVAFELGLFGLVLMVTAVSLSIRGAWSSCLRASLVPAWCALLIFSATLSMEYERTWWLLISLGIAAGWPALRAEGKAK